MTRLSYIVVDRLSSFHSEAGIRELLAGIRELGYAGAELQLTRPAGASLDRLEQWLEELDLVVPSFLTGEAYSEGLCLASPDPVVRGRAVARLIEYLDVAARFKALLVVGLMQGLRSDEPDTLVANDRIVGCLQQVGDVAESKGVRVVIEPVNHLQVGFNHTVLEVRRLTERVGSAAVGVMVDTIHMHIEERSATQPIIDLGNGVWHVHLCESNGGPFGTGQVDFAATWRALASIGYQGFASVKVYRKAGPLTGARLAMEHLRQLGLV
jgi:5-keto-L-gluconate epimerase